MSEWRRNAYGEIMPLSSFRWGEYQRWVEELADQPKPCDEPVVCLVGVGTCGECGHYIDDHADMPAPLPVFLQAALDQIDADETTKRRPPADG